MEFESVQNNTTAKLFILKLGEYEMWVIRIKLYFQVQDYALWEVIENGNSWVSVPQTTQENGVSVKKMSVLVTAEEKINKKNDVKARSLLLMALPNEHQLTFSVIFTQEDLNSNFLRSLPPEWNTHVVVGMNKADIKTMSIDNLYNNFKIVEQDVKKSVGTSTGAQNMAFMTAPNTSSTNDVNTAYPAYDASPVSPNVNTASPQHDLEKIHKDDLEAMDLRWQLSLLNMMAKRECRAQRNQDGRFKNQDNTRKQGNNKDTSSKPILAIDDKLIGSQITDNNKKGLRYHAVPPPYSLIYNGPTKLDLSYSGLDEFKEPKFKGYGPRDSKLESNINNDKKLDDSKENSGDSFVKEQVSKDTSSFVKSPLNVDKGTTFSVDKKIEFVKPKHHEKPVRRSVSFDMKNIASKESLTCLVAKATLDDNGINILKSIDEGLFQMGTLRETLAEGTEGALHLGPERPQVYSNLTSEEKDMYNADIRATNILLQGLPKDICSLINHYTDAKDI
uniref:Ribonuclease H-like domain-containing protein n=1 Tax=Tanacetum cinerariifolium TaxID=118510 RepID=A0A6L2PCL9_TANCI|nr:ribonuclease H-like domain-containing protein [Tanacetum cinerariifolium]